MDSYSNFSYSQIFSSILLTVWNFILHYFKIIVDATLPSSKEISEDFPQNKFNGFKPVQSKRKLPSFSSSSSISDSAISKTSLNLTSHVDYPNDTRIDSHFDTHIDSHLDHSVVVVEPSNLPRDSSISSIDSIGSDSSDEAHTHDLDSLESSIDSLDQDASESLQELDIENNGQQKKSRRRRRRSRKSKSSLDESLDTSIKDQPSGRKRQQSFSSSQPQSGPFDPPSRLRSHSMRENRPSVKVQRDPASATSSASIDDSKHRRFSHSALTHLRDEEDHSHDIRPVRQPIGPSLVGNGFSEEYRRSRILNRA